ncbi:MAG: hypothetical protein JWO64_3541, partial [Hyphomicrobiales bacterium]|nr:hypothetical protein [Hyphomicrobiales bacterium]
MDCRVAALLAMTNIRLVIARSAAT